ncbi:MAG: class I SAM-dependent methyltransferase [Candidatus Omnitrophota bacterium]
MKRAVFPNWRKAISLFVLVAFLTTGLNIPLARSQSLSLPPTGQMLSLSAPFEPVLLRGMKVYPQDPFRFDFILDKGGNEAGSLKLIKYFLASLTTSEKDLWVNLSPYEKDRIIPDALARTELGRDLLAEDYVLKQLSSSLMHPDGAAGRVLWRKIYAALNASLGTTDVPLDMFNKVWIMPDTAKVFEKADRAFVIKARLKVMLDADHLALSSQGDASASAAASAAAPEQALTQKALREVIIPILEKEVNEGANFAQLRQIYQALILSIWFKKRMKASILGRNYIDRGHVSGIALPGEEGAQDKQQIYERYLEAFKKGVYNLIREEADPANGDVIPRKYFSGGFGVGDFAAKVEWARSVDPSEISDRPLESLTVDVAGGRVVNVADQIEARREFLVAARSVRGTENTVEDLAVLEQIILRRSEAPVVLEIGFGNAAWALAMADKEQKEAQAAGRTARQFILIDADKSPHSEAGESSSMVPFSEVRENIRSRGLANIVALRADMDFLDLLPDGAADDIVLINPYGPMLDEIFLPGGRMPQFANVLKPGGQIIVRPNGMTRPFLPGDNAYFGKAQLKLLKEVKKGSLLDFLSTTPVGANYFMALKRRDFAEKTAPSTAKLRMMASYLKIYREAIQRGLLDPKKVEHALNLGAGSGWDARMFLKAFPSARFIGVESYPDALEAFNATPVDRDRFTIVPANALDLQDSFDFQSAADKVSFDLVVLQNPEIYTTAEDYKKALGYIASRMKDDGKFVIVMDKHRRESLEDGNPQLMEALSGVVAKPTFSSRRVFPYEYLPSTDPRRQSSGFMTIPVRVYVITGAELKAAVADASMSPEKALVGKQKVGRRDAAQNYVLKEVRKINPEAGIAVFRLADMLDDNGAVRGAFRFALHSALARGDGIQIDLAGMEGETFYYSKLQARFALFARQLAEHYGLNSKEIPSGETSNTGRIGYVLTELLKNAFTHGNGLKASLPILFYFNPWDRQFFVMDQHVPQEERDPVEWEKANFSIFGFGKGLKRSRDPTEFGAIIHMAEVEGGYIVSAIFPRKLFKRSVVDHAMKPSTILNVGLIAAVLYFMPEIKTQLVKWQKQIGMTPRDLVVNTVNAVATSYENAASFDIITLSQVPADPKSREDGLRTLANDLERLKAVNGNPQIQDELRALIKKYDPSMITEPDIAGPQALLVAAGNDPYWKALFKKYRPVYKYEVQSADAQSVSLVKMGRKTFYLKAMTDKGDMQRELFAYRVARSMGVNVPHVVALSEDDLLEIKDLSWSDAHHYPFALLIQAAEEMEPADLSSGSGSGIEELVAFAHLTRHNDWSLGHNFKAVFIGGKYREVVYDLPIDLRNEGLTRDVLKRARLYKAVNGSIAYLWRSYLDKINNVKLLAVIDRVSKAGFFQQALEGIPGEVVGAQYLPARQQQLKMDIIRGIEDCQDKLRYFPSQIASARDLKAALRAAPLTDVGGIDLDPTKVDLQITGEVPGLPVYQNGDPVNVNIDYENIRPVIIGVQPLISAAMFLGLSESPVAGGEAPHV